MSQKHEIEKEHPAYQLRRSQWKRCRDVIAGADAVKAAGTLYLPKLPGQNDDRYENYKQRAVFYNASGRTHEGLTGLVMGKEPKVEGVTTANEALVNDCDLRGRPFAALLEDAIEDVIAVGRFVAQVDFPVAPEGVTRGDAQEMNLRPYCIEIPTENVINWGYERIQNHWRLSRVVIRETAVYIDQKGKEFTDFRYLELVLQTDVNQETGESVLAFHVKVWTLDLAPFWVQKRSFHVTSDTIPIMDGAPLDRVPVFFFGVEYGDEDPDKPPLLDLVDINLHHYLTSADKRHALYHCGLPTPLFTGNWGFKKGQEIPLGGTSALATTDPNAKATYLEFAGQGIEPLKQEEEALEAKMAKLGARMLAEDKKAAEAAETLKIRASGESSTLASIAKSVSRTARDLLAFMVEWGGGESEGVAVALNTDFKAPGLSAQDVVALTAAVQAGELPTREYLLTLLGHGYIVSDRKNPVDEIEAELEVTRASRGFGGLE